ncbi:MAG: ribonuclease R [Gemmatimonadota bacterium]
MIEPLPVGPEDIIRQLKERPLKPKDLAKALDISGSAYRDFRDLLSRLEDEGRVYRQRKGRYGVPRDLNLVVGVLQTTRQGDGFVVRETPGEADVFVRRRNLGSAVEGDRIVVRVEKHRPGRNPEGRLVRVLTRAWSQVVGAYTPHKGYGVVHPREPALNLELFIPAEAAGEAAKAPAGTMVVAEIEEWGQGEVNPVGRVTRVLGAPEDPGVDVLSIIIGHQLPLEFPADVDKEADKIARRGVRSEDLEGREDFREDTVFTIDPADAQDHDDALSVRKGPDGEFTVGVHIADVSYYVKPGSALDREAFDRGTSVYLVDRVVPMLPHVLSGGLCSLKLGQDRLTMSVILRIAADGTILDRRIVRGVIHSRAKLSYEDAQAILDGGSDGAKASVEESVSHLVQLSRSIRRRRQRAGSIDFDLPESRVILDEAGKPEAILRIERLEAHQLIEDFMILANETVAESALGDKLPLIYRVHETPSEDKMENLRSVAAAFGHTLPSGTIKPKHIAKLVRAAEGAPQERLIQTVTLRSMKRAIYSTNNVGHFGLASRAYAHFTSPIRRYPDLTVHRQLVRRMAGKTGKGPRDQTQAERLEKTALHSSERERRAVAAERDSVDLKKVEYMEAHLGDEFSGTIAGVTAFGLFILLDAVHVEGLVHVSTLGADYYEFDEERHTLTGRRGGHRFGLGDPVQVQVARVDKEARKIDFELLGTPA